MFAHQTPLTLDRGISIRPVTARRPA